VAQGLGGGLGQFFRDEVPGWHGLARDQGAAPGLPQGQRLEELLHHTALAPQHQRVAGDTLAPGAAGAVVFEVDAGAGAVVFTCAVDGLGAAEAAFVFGQGLRFDVRQAGRSAGAMGRGRAPAAELGVQIGARVAADHEFGQGGGLDQVEPVVVGPGEGHVGALVHVQRGGDVDQAELAHAVGVVQRQAVRHATAPVVSTQVEGVDAQRIGHIHHILCHGALAVVGMVRQAGRVGGIAVTA
jgi:hypothetical protein